MEDLNRLYCEEPAFWESDYDHHGFYWVDCTDTESSVLSFIRQNKDGSRKVLVVMNLTPILRSNYRIGLPQTGRWNEVFNSDAAIYGGSNQGNMGAVTTEEYACHNQRASATFNLPPCSVMVFRPE